jgi:hypothetical protein
MKPKIFVGIAIMLSILVAGLILVLGFSSDAILPVSLLIFLLAFSALTIYVARGSLEGKVFIAIAMLTLLALSTTFYLTSLKTYHEVVNTYGTLDSSPEIQLIQSQNDYYLAYADYLNHIISEYQARSKTLEAQLNILQKLELAQQQANIAPPTPTITPVPVTNPPETSYITYPVQESNEGNDE